MAFLTEQGPEAVAVCGGTGDEDDGLPLTDEILLLICAGFLNTVDLVRCAATCRRWRRLVSTEAEYICRSASRCDRFARGLAVGFFHQKHDVDSSSADSRGLLTALREAPRFIPLLPCFRRASLAALFDKELFKSSRIIASRKGRLALELRRVSRAAVLRLAVCNPMTGDVSILPALSGRDKPGCYACALLTADDLHNTDHALRPRSSAFQLVLVYNRRSFAACRSYSSDTNTWGAEGRVTGAKISGERLSEMSPAVAVRGAVFWRVDHAVFGLRLDTLEAKVETLPLNMQPCVCLGHRVENLLLTVWPDGRLCTLEIARGFGGTPTPLSDFAVRILFREHHAGDDMLSGRWGSSPSEVIRLGPFVPNCVTTVCMLGLCEKSGVVFLAVGSLYWNQRHMYALDLTKKEKQLVPAVLGDVECNRCVPESYGGFYAYEMDRVSFLSSLG